MLNEPACMGLQPLGIWKPGNEAPVFCEAGLSRLSAGIRRPVHIVFDRGRLGVGQDGQIVPGTGRGGYPLISSLPALYPEWLGERSFLETHGVRFSYVAGAMFRGITSADMVIAMARAGMLAFFGAAGLKPAVLEKHLLKIGAAVGDRNWGSNLIHSPAAPGLEQAVVDLYLRLGVRRVSASAYMQLSPAVVHYAAKGLSRDPGGAIRRQNHVFAKVSRPEVAAHFMKPPPKDMLESLVAAGRLTAAEAELAMQLPVAGDVTVEADSGGHTDNRPLTVVFPAVVRLRDRLQQQYDYPERVRIGAAGGLGTPGAVAAAYALGAAYVLTGSVNQACVESGLSADARRLLLDAGVADVTMAPAADMFEMGVRVQVLKRGTMFSNRAASLYRIYQEHASLESLPPDLAARLEKEVFRAPLAEVWGQVRDYLAKGQPEKLQRAQQDPRLRMALVFRWYLGQSARRAIAGDPAHRLDYQICCGPAMGAFNDWVRGSFLEAAENRGVVQVALNLLEGAACLTRAQQLRSYGLSVPAALFNFRPRPLQPEG